VPPFALADRLIRVPEGSGLGGGTESVERGLVGPMTSERRCDQSAVLTEGLTMTPVIVSFHDPEEARELLERRLEPSVVGAKDLDQLSFSEGVARTGFGRVGGPEVPSNSFQSHVDGRADLFEGDRLQKNQPVARVPEPGDEPVERFGGRREMPGRRTTHLRA